MRSMFKGSAHWESVHCWLMLMVRTVPTHKRPGMPVTAKRRSRAKVEMATIVSLLQTLQATCEILRAQVKT